MKSIHIKGFIFVSLVIVTGCTSAPIAQKQEKQITEPQSLIDFKKLSGLPLDVPLATLDAEANAWVKTLPPADANYGPYPTEYKQIVTKYLRGILKDPDSAKIAKISKPREEHKINSKYKKQAIYGYSSCALVNAKNSYGGYVGERPYWFFIKDGSVIEASDDMGAIYIGRSKNCADG